MTKNFYDWFLLKEVLHEKIGRVFFKEREIWWCSLGCNIGDEQDGKNKYFERPVIVFRRFNSNIFWGLPLSSKYKENRYYIPISYNGKRYSVIGSQLRLFDAKRLIRRITRISKEDFKYMKQKVIELI